MPKVGHRARRCEEERRGASGLQHGWPSACRRCQGRNGARRRRWRGSCWSEKSGIARVGTGMGGIVRDVATDEALQACGDGSVGGSKAFAAWSGGLVMEIAQTGQSGSYD